MSHNTKTPDLTHEGRAFNSKLTVNTLDLIQNGSSQNRDKVESWLDPEKMRVNIGFCGGTSEIEARQLESDGSSLLSNVLTVSQAADLLVVHPATIRKACRNGKYINVQKQLIDGGDGWLIPITSLPASAQTKHYKAQKQAIQQAATAALAKAGISSPAPVTENERHEEFQRMQEWYDRKPANFKTRVEKNLTVLRAYLAYRDQGMTVGDAELALKNSHGVNRSTIRRYLSATKNYPVYVWAAALCSKHKGGRGKAEFSLEAKTYILQSKITTKHAKTSVLYREAKKLGASLGWVIPSEDTVAKWLNDQPAHLFLTDKELERSYPTVIREYKMLVNEVWETDGRKGDVMCVWPDGSIGRPFVIMYRDLRSRYVLGVRFCKNPDAEAAAGAFGQALKKAQAVPKWMKVDNGREYDNHMITAGQKNRNRREFRADVSDGLWTSMGIEAIFSEPGKPRDKAIESGWNFIAQNVDKSTLMSKAYLGHNPVSKPEDFDDKNACSIQLYAALFLDEVNNFHHRPHTGNGMFGRTPHEVFNDPALRAVSRKPSESEMGKCRMGKKQLKLNPKEDSFTFTPKGSIYAVKFSAPELRRLSSYQKKRPFDVYYDFYGEPDSPVSVWQDNMFICEATDTLVLPVIGADTEEVVNHVKAKRDYMKSVKQDKKDIEKLAMNILKGHVQKFYYQQDLEIIPQEGIGFEIRESVKPKALAAPVSAFEPVEGNPNALKHKLTGKILIEHEEEEMTNADKAEAERKRRDAILAEREKLVEQEEEKSAQYRRAS